MNKRTDNRFLFNLTVVVVFLFTILLSCVDVFAADRPVRAYDETDMEIYFNENNYALNAGNVTFVLDRDILLPGEIFVYEDGGLITAVNDYTYVMEATDDGEIRFVNFYIKKGDRLENIADSPYFVEFADSIRLSPDVTYTDNGDGRAPALSVGVRPWVHTWLTMDSGNGKKEKHITGKTDLSFPDDGVYRVSVYTVDGLGNRTYSKKIPEEIIVDKKPPVITSVDTDSESADSDGTVFKDTVTLSAKAWDERSSIQGIYWEAAGEAAKADSLTINAPFKGSIFVYAKDSAGNVSEKLEYFPELTVDDEPPVISFLQKGEENGRLRLGISAKDALSGTGRLTTVFDGKVVSDKKGSSDEVSIDLSDADNEEKELIIRATDIAGNRSERSVMIKKSDTTAPVIGIYGVSDRGVYGSDVEIMIDARDDSGILESYNANIFVKDTTGRMIFSRTTDSKKIKITQSGAVTITAKAEDREGNKASSSVTFILDKDAPVINGISQYDGQTFEEFELKEEPENMIEDLTCVSYDVYLNGLEYDGSRITQTGNYILKLVATDEFGRKSESRAEFTVKKEEEEEEKPAVAQILENEIPKKSGASVNRIPADKLAENKISKPAVSQDVISDNDTLRNVVFENTSSVNTVSSDETLQDPAKKEGFFTRLRCGILKLLGLSR